MPPAALGAPAGAPMASAGLPLTGWRQTFSSLSGNRDFNYLFYGNIGFYFGMNMMIILRGWLVFDRWDNASYLGYIMATVAVPMLLLAPIGGVIADRVDKRQLLLLTQGTLVFTNSVVAALIIVDRIEFWHLLVVSTLSGAAFSFNMPVRQALVAMLVPRDRLMNAVSLSTGAMNASRIVAPPIAGLLVGPIGIGGAYIVSTAFYASAAVLTLLLPHMPARRERAFTFVEDFSGGFTYIKGSALLVGLLLFATVPMIFALPYQTLLPVFADRIFDVGSAGFGIMQAASGVGGLIGAFIVANLDSYPRKGRLMLGGTLVFGSLLVGFGLSPVFPIALLVLVGIGFASMIVMTVNNTLIQLVIPDEVRGRVMSVMMMSFGLMPLGSVPAGIIAEAVGARYVVVAGGLLFVASVMMIFSFIPAFRTLDEDFEEGRRRESVTVPSEGDRAATSVPAGGAD